jgi:hypothetical protein
MSESAPYEVVAQPFEAYRAPVATVFPEIQAEPSEDWDIIGTSGDRNYSEDGVTIQHTQSVEEFRSLGSVGPIKAFRTEEGLRISFVLHDVSLEQYARSLNDNTVTTVPAAGTSGGYKKVGLSRGRVMSEFALLLRGSGASPYGPDWNVQYEVPKVVQVGEAEVVYQKGEPAGIQLEFLALEDPDAASEDERFGRLIAQNAEPT